MPHAKQKVRAIFRRETSPDPDFPSFRTERVYQLLERRWLRWHVIEEQIVPEEEFVPYILGKSKWVPNFEKVKHASQIA